MFYMTALILNVGNFINLFAKKYFKWIPRLLIFFMWIVFWGSHDNPDSFNYLRMYDLQNSNDFGYNVLIRIGNFFHLSYTSFLVFISLAGFILIFRTVSKYCENKSWMLLLYFFYPFMLDVVQVRNFLSMAMVIYAVNFLIRGYRHDNLKYITMVCLASTIQITSLIYLWESIKLKFEKC